MRCMMSFIPLKKLIKSTKNRRNQSLPYYCWTFFRPEAQAKTAISILWRRRIGAIADPVLDASATCNRTGNQNPLVLNNTWSNFADSLTRLLSTAFSNYINFRSIYFFLYLVQLLFHLSKITTILTICVIDKWQTNSFYLTNKGF